MIENKLYVVIGVLLIILTGLFVYLFSMDRKLRRLEKKQKEFQSVDDNTGLVSKE